jgi:membrane protein
VVVAAAVTRRFIEGRPPATSTVLSEALDVPPPAVEDVLESLVRAGVLVKVVEGEDLGYDPGRDVDAVRMADVEEGVRMDPRARQMKDALERSVGPALGTLLRSRRDAAFKDSGSLTLRQLASQCLVKFQAVRVETRPATGSGAALDPGQPRVHA